MITSDDNDEKVNEEIKIADSRFRVADATALIKQANDVYVVTRNPQDLFVRTRAAEAYLEEKESFSKFKKK